MRKAISSITVIIIFINLLFSNILFAAEGPSQPEAAQFEPIDTSDMVDIYSGNFNYNIPIMEVPGPEGNWPISMSYHAGIGPNTEATWVGLGWTLNPGSINRFMNGYPDDYWGGSVRSHFYAEKQKGWGISIGVSYGPVGMNMTYDSYTGKSGLNASLGLSAAIQSVTGIPLSLGPLGFDISVGTSGISIGLAYSSMGSNGIGASLGINANIGTNGKTSFSASAGIGGKGASNSITLSEGGNLSTSIGLMGCSFSTGSNGGARYSVGGIGYQSQSSNTSKGNLKTSGFSFPIPTPIPGLYFSFSYSEWEWWLDEWYGETAIGCIQQLGYENYNLDEIWTSNSNNVINQAVIYNENINYASTSTLSSNSFSVPKMERSMINYSVEKNMILSSEDNYVVAAQGLSGIFRPFFEYNYTIYDIDGDDNETGYYTSDTDKNIGENIVFRFEGDQGGNFISLSNFGSFDNDYQEINSNNGSKKIKPAIDLERGTLLGFEITAEDGKKYEFYQPVFSHYEYSVKYHDREDDDTQMSENFMCTPYATSWMLTGVKGPDYVDRGTAGFTEDDWGLWVKFNYSETGLIPHRTPHWDPSEEDETYIVDAVRDKNESATEGIKEKVYLSSIETASHIAEFSTNINSTSGSVERYDMKPTKLKKDMSVGACSWTGEDPVTIIFPFDKSALSDFDLTNVSFDVFYNSWGVPYSGTNMQGEQEWYQDWVENFIVEKNNINLSAVNDPVDGDNSFSIYLGGVHNSPVASPLPSPDDIMLYSYIDQVTMKLEPLPSLYQNNKSKKLDKIIVKNKAYANEIIEGIEFDYDYSMQHGAPNATTGKLTLKSITKLGENESPTLPPTLFSYDFNPIWREHTWDFWGGYTSEGTREYHLNSMIKATADQDASAWNLTGIITAFGSKIHIDYESDYITKIGGDDENMLSLFTPWTYVPYYYNFPNGTHNWMPLLSERIRDCYDSYFQTYNSDMPATISYFMLVADHDLVGKQTGVQMTGYDNDKVYFDTSLDFTRIGSGYHSGLNQSEYWWDPYLEEVCMEDNVIYPFLFSIAPNFMYGGGHRVKSVSIYSNGSKKSTNYSYSNGYIPCMPSMAFAALDFHRRSGNFTSDYGVDADDRNYQPEKALFNYRYNLIGPSPAVGYDSVEIYESDETGSIINGKTIHQYWTSNDLPFKDCIETENENVNGSIDYQAFIDDTGKLGRLKSITIQGLKPGTNGTSNEDFYTIKKDEINYNYSNELATSERKVILNGNNVTTENPLGLTQQKYTTKFEDEDTKYIDHIKENIFTTCTTSSMYIYDIENGDYNNATGTITTSMSNIGFDAKSGGVLVTENIGSKGERTISEMKPAHWYYEAMDYKNMLTQSAASIGYSIPSTQTSDYWTLQSNGSAKNYITGANITTWSNQFVIDGSYAETAWRQKDMYQFIGDNANFDMFSAWTTSDPGNFIQSNGEDIWKRTSNITSYDRFNHPIEEIGIDGVSTSAIYGYGDALPVAIATNSKNSEIDYCSFESGDLTGNNVSWSYGTNGTGTWEVTQEEYHNGVNAIKYTKTDDVWAGCYMDAPYIVVVPGESYTISAWYKCDVDRNAWINWRDVINAASYDKTQAGTGEWELIEHTYTAPAGCTQLKVYLYGHSGSANTPIYYDDVRVHPTDANMSTYTYDPLTWKVTSITDVNNVSSYYEYDDVGRLDIIRDQDRNIITKHNYMYARPMSE
jgi:Carbohydrate binding domain